MGFVFSMLGIAGIAGAIELGENPKIAIIILAIGVIFLARDYKKFIEEERRR